MNLYKKTLILLAALVFAFTAGCSKKNDSSAQDQSSDAVSSQSDSSQDDSSTQSQAPVKVDQGDKIKAAAGFFENEKYEYICKVTGSGADAVVTLAKNNGVCKQTTDYGFTKSVIYCKGADTFRYDGITKAFVKEIGKITTDPTGNLITETVKKELPPTSTHINAEDAKKYDAEEYTYTGGTYITILDFYFDKKTGMLSKYTVTSSVEGKDDEVETRQVLRMTSKDTADIDFSEIELRNDYTDFSALSETDREQFCKKLFERRGVKEEDLYEAGLTMFDLKKISYDDLSAFMIGFTAKQNEKK